MNTFSNGQTVLYDSNHYEGLGKPLPPLEAKVLKVTDKRVQIEFYDPGYKQTVRRFVRPDKLLPLPAVGDDMPTVNGLEAELDTLRRQYADLSDTLAGCLEVLVCVCAYAFNPNDASVNAGQMTDSERLAGAGSQALSVLGQIGGVGND